MSLQSKVLLFLIISICIALLTISIYPGVLNSFLFPILLVLIFCMPIFVIVGFFALIVFRRRGYLRKIKLSWQVIKPISAILLTTCVLLSFHVPIRLAFLLSQSDFEQFIVNNEVKSNRKLGFYRVDKYRIDFAGGKYFLVNSHGDGLSTDVVFYGFTYQPNLEKSPFGSANYQLSHLYGDWYLFQVSNDY